MQPTRVRLHRHESPQMQFDLACAPPAEGIRTYVREYVGCVARSSVLVWRRELPSGDVPLIINCALTVRERKAASGEWREHGTFTAGLHDASTLVTSGGPTFGMQINFTAIAAAPQLARPIAWAWQALVQTAGRARVGPHVRRRAIGFLVAAAVHASVAFADPVDDYIRSQLAPRHLPGVSLAVVKDGRIVKSAGYGLANLELQVPATEKTVYEIGSISKQFAANAVLLLVEDGKVKLDDLISTYLPFSPRAWSAITVRHVLTHTAGLADFDTGNIGFSYRREYTPLEFIELLSKQPLDFQPGERWNYTNGFPLLGMVVERASGMPFVDFVRSRIFTPLGLESARFKTAGDVVPHRADGYVFKDGAYRHGEPLRPAVIAANGGVMMNAVDFAKWDIAITEGRLLRRQSVTEMTTPVRLNSGQTVSHGLGWFIDTFNGHRFGAHWGTTVAGYSAVIRRYVDDRLTVIVMANADDSGVGTDAMSKRVADMYVPGVDIHNLEPKRDPAQEDTARLKKTLATIAAGTEDERAPGLASRLPAPVRARMAAALQAATAFDYLGEETVGPGHFNLDPRLTRIRRYRLQAADGMRFLTLRLSRDGVLLGAIIED